MFSMVFTGILTIFFAVAIGYATFIENDYGTITSKILIYNARWFEALLVLLAVNLVGSIFVNKLYQRKKWPILLFHVAFIFILIGAAITRYFGYEGYMHIREGESSDYIISEETYIQMVVHDGDETIEEIRQVSFSPYTSNRFSESLNINGQTVHVGNLRYIPSAGETPAFDPTGEPVLSLTVLDARMQRMSLNLRDGEIKALEGRTIGLNSGNVKPDLDFSLNNDVVAVVATDSIFAMKADGSRELTGLPHARQQINTQTVYAAGPVHFAVNRFFQKGVIQAVHIPSEEGTRSDAIQVDVAVDGVSKNLVAFGKNGMVGEPAQIQLGDMTMEISYGARKIELPFSLHLNDFQLERYPGSNSPSSFASEVVLKDGELEKPYRIYMNNILKYKGFRFFQSSYDTDEQGTVLSVNSDAWGTAITYFGYFIMMLGFVFTLFIKNSRFSKLVKASAKLREDRKKLFALIVMGMLVTSVNAQSGAVSKQLNNRHVAEFETLLLQSQKGRVEPAATLASEILRKVAKKNNWNGMSSSGVFLLMQARPEQWKSEEIIKVDNADLRRQLGISGEYTSFNRLVLPRDRGGYLLGPMANEAFGKKSSERTRLDKEIINVDERVNILFNVFSGNYLTIFPVPGDTNNKWVSANDAGMPDTDAENFAKQVTANYLGAVAGNDWGTASSLLDRIKDYQRQEGADIIPSDLKIKLEVLYHKADIFGKLSKVLLTFGLILLLVQLYSIFNPAVKADKFRRFSFFLILLFFVIQTLGLAIRWYVSGHAPWSNGYESMIFVSWAILGTGLMLAQRSEITLSLTTMLAGLTLLVAGFSWMSPEITNLVPVLKSYWLIVHVAIIMASYGFLGIGAMLGLLNMILMVLKGKKNEARVNHTIKELVVIIHISLIAGLFLLAAGSFIGGIWANESWGRYWGWDPKETWAMVTILVYSFIVHMHKIPGLQGNFQVSAAALLGFGSVLMTYFGVNYYLSGMHSYAQGDPPPVPAGVYIAVVLVLLLVSAAFFAQRNLKHEEPVIPS